jgi:hypothetical protein
MALELKALEARRAFRNGIVELSVEHLKSGTNPAPPNFDLRITFDGNRIVSEKRELASSKTQRRVFDGSTYTFDTGNSNERIIMTSKAVADAKYLLIDPRLLGVYALSVDALAGCSLEDVLARTDRTDEELRMEEMSGRTVARISRNLYAGKLQTDLWIAPDLNYSVVKLAVVSSTSRPARIELLPEYGDPFGDIWYPKRITYRKYRLPSDQLEEEEVVTVKSAFFNQGVESALFAFAAFNPIVGEAVRKDGAIMVWNGSGLVSTQDAGQLATARPRLKFHWVWLSASVLLAILAFVVLRRRTTTLWK